MPKNCTEGSITGRRCLQASMYTMPPKAPEAAMAEPRCARRGSASPRPAPSSGLGAGARVRMAVPMMPTTAPKASLRVTGRRRARRTARSRRGTMLLNTSARAGLVKPSATTKVPKWKAHPRAAAATRRRFSALLREARTLREAQRRTRATGRRMSAAAWKRQESRVRRGRDWPSTRKPSSVEDIPRRASVITIQPMAGTDFSTDTLRMSGATSSLDATAAGPVSTRRRRGTSMESD
mmetsp:Transcript_18108/g.60593  ORF Transcript_18108/g.60593 Transcript_18108/m.60593 type:complete len:237 (-) Transcript_18108:1376-2086(-)